MDPHVGLIRGMKLVRSEFMGGALVGRPPLGCRCTYGTYGWCERGPVINTIRVRCWRPVTRRSPVEPHVGPIRGMKRRGGRNLWVARLWAGPRWAALTLTVRMVGVSVVPS